MKRSSIFIVTFFLSLPVFAEEAATPNLSSTLLQVFGALVFVIALILASAWSAKKLKITGSDSLSGIRVLASLNVGRREKVMLIESCGKKILLGVAAGNVSVLHVYEGDVVVTHRKIDEENTAEQQTKSNPNFSRFLQAVLSGGRPNEK